MSDPAPAAAPAAKPGGGDKSSPWTKVWIGLVALCLGGIAFNMFMTSAIADTAQYFYQRRGGIQYFLQFWRELGFMILSAGAVVLIIRHFSK